MKTINKFAFLMTFLFLTIASANAAFGGKKGENGEDKKVYQAVEWPDYDGSKIGVAILSFEDGLSPQAAANWIDADTGVQVHFGLGDGLSNMLVSTLLSTGRFNIIDKKIARKLFEIYSEDTAKKVYEGSANLPKVPGIQYFILGSMTAFDDGASGAEGGVGFGGVRLSGGKSVASLMIHMRIIDATSGQVVYSAPVEGSASVSNAGISVAGVGNLSAFKAAPIGQAIQQMLDRATDDIIVTSFPGTESIFAVDEAEEEAPSQE